MGQGQHVAQRPIVRHEDARFFAPHGAGAKAAGALARARFPIDPIPGDHLLVKEIAERRISTRKRFAHHRLGDFPRKRLLIRQIERRAEIEPGDVRPPHEACFELENTAGNFEIRHQGLEHGIKSLARDRGLKQGDIEEMIHGAMVVKREARAGYGVDRRGCRVLDCLPSRVAAFERRFSYTAIGVIHQRAALRHRQTPSCSIGKSHVELELGGNGVVKPSPRLYAIDAEIGGQYFFVSGHGAPGFFTQPIQVIFGAFERGSRRKGRERFAVGFFDGAQKFNSNFRNLCAHSVNLGFFFEIGFIARVR